MTGKKEIGSGFRHVLTRANSSVMQPFWKLLNCVVVSGDDGLSAPVPTAVIVQTELHDATIITWNARPKGYGPTRPPRPLRFFSPQRSRVTPSISSSRNASHPTPHPSISQPANRLKYRVEYFQKSTSRYESSQQTWPGG
jgi:hypothetical protein